MTVYRKFEVCASYESSVVKSPPSPSRKPLSAILTATVQTSTEVQQIEKKLYL